MKAPTIDQLVKMRDAALYRYKLAKDNKGRADTRYNQATEEVDALNFFICQAKDKAVNCE